MGVGQQGGAQLGTTLAGQEMGLKGDGRALMEINGTVLLTEKDLGRTVVVSVLWLRKEFPTGWANH